MRTKTEKRKPPHSRLKRNNDFSINEEPRKHTVDIKIIKLLMTDSERKHSHTVVYILIHGKQNKNEHSKHQRLFSLSFEEVLTQNGHIYLLIRNLYQIYCSLICTDRISHDKWKYNCASMMYQVILNNLVLKHACFPWCSFLHSSLTDTFTDNMLV